MNRDLDYVLNYMVKYTKDKFMQDSEPMLNHNDIEIVLKHIYELEEEKKKLKECIVSLIDDDTDLQLRINKAIEYIAENKHEMYPDQVKDLLNILRGVENDKD